jgi:hypothetical protein
MVALGPPRRDRGGAKYLIQSAVDKGDR